VRAWSDSPAAKLVSKPRRRGRKKRGHSLDS
jgi:hypothetical protein